MPGVILLIVIGAAAGVLATRLMRVNVDLPAAILLGIIGAIVGSVALRLLLATGGWIVSLVVATLAAMALIWAWQHIRR